MGRGTAATSGREQYGGVMGARTARRAAIRWHTLGDRAAERHANVYPDPNDPKVHGPGGPLKTKKSYTTRRHK